MIKDELFLPLMGVAVLALLTIFGISVVSSLGKENCSDICAQEIQRKDAQISKIIDLCNLEKSTIDLSE